MTDVQTVFSKPDDVFFVNVATKHRAEQVGSMPAFQLSEKTLEGPAAWLRQVEQKHFGNSGRAGPPADGIANPSD